MKVKCQYCGATFKTRPSRIARGHGKFCSISCSLRQPGRVKVKPNKWRKGEDDTAIIELTQEQETIIDIEDLERVLQHRWCAHWCPTTRGFYVSHTLRKNEQGHARLARFLMNAPDGMVVDHINHDTLDNRKQNLRICTQAENIRNVRVRKNKQTSCYKGVTYHESSGKWQARIGYEGDVIHIGSFSSELEAAKAYNEVAVEYFGEFAFPNELL